MSAGLVSGLVGEGFPEEKKFIRSGGHWRFVPLLLAATWVLSEGARGDAFSRYAQAGSFTLPAGAAMFDALLDGRLITLSGSTIYVETTPGSGTFASAGNLAGADFPSFGAAFLRVSPDGTRFAVGNNGGASFSNFKIGVFDVSHLAGGWFSAAHYDAAWIDNVRLAITAGDLGSPAYVTILDTNSPIPVSPDNRTVIAGIGGASAGVAIDSSRNLFTGNGFEGNGPSGTGAIKAFAQSQWEAAYAANTPLSFETQGILVADVLSASPLDFDAEGNLLVGGGDFSQSDETDFVAVVRSSAIAAALAGQGPINTSDPAKVRRLDPDAGNDFNYYFAAANPALSRAYAKDASESTVHVYVDTTAVPAVSTWGVIDMALLVAITGSVAVHRRSAGCAS